MKNSKLLEIIIIISLIITFSGCIFNNNGNNNNKNNEYEYIVNINTESNNNFTLIIPLVVNITDVNISPIMSDLSIEGNGNYLIKNTQFGPGLNITGYGNIKIRSKGKLFVDYGVLSLKYDSDGDGILKDEGPDVEYWYFFETNNKTNIILEITCEIKHENGCYKSELFKTEISENEWKKTKDIESVILP